MRQVIARHVNLQVPAGDAAAGFAAAAHACISL
jgi:hypothetical protein